MLSIKEFSEMCHLTPQTLRYYHAEGLLVPAEVDEQTGYRGYTFDQVEQAMMVTALRGAGMSVKLVRRALDQPDTASALLRQHVAEVERARREQDEAITDAREFLTARPEPVVRRSEPQTVVSMLVPGVVTGPGDDWAETRTSAAAAVREVTAAIEAAGATPAGAPWRSMAIETPEQKRNPLTPEGPHWLVKVPFTGSLAAPLPPGMEVRDFPARDELVIRMPGHLTVAKYTTAIAKLAGHVLEDAYIDLSRTRDILHDDHVESAAAIRLLADEPE